MGYQKIKVPVDGDKITVNADLSLNVPNHPIIPYIEGDGIGVPVGADVGIAVGATVGVVAAGAAWWSSWWSPGFSGREANRRRRPTPVSVAGGSVAS